ncbi:MAG: excinuclease ABC subunit UvrC [Bacteroidaceae bacterium]|nr:excinuclease ABC subunit UvrC [Bacteroidaceae bacterium]
MVNYLDLPSTPGVYKFFNEEDKIIYVGKAKNLKRRVSSYFTKTHDSPKTNILVSHIRRLEYICVDTEADALLLENNLIKKYQPRYNILLKDGKTYPWLCITKEDYPRVYKTRVVKRGADYFGPYPSSYTLDLLLTLIQDIFPVRTCRLPITEKSVDENKYKECLQYHIHRCNAPCVGRQSREEYNKMINQIRDIAKGNSHLVTDYLLKQMQELGEQMRFEEAQILKQQYDAILHYQSKTVITTTSDSDIDVFGFDEDEGSAYINILRINNGSVVQGYTIEYKKTLEDETKEEILALAIVELRDKFKSVSSIAIVPFLPDTDIKGVEFIVPQRGDKHTLLQLSQRNVAQYRVDKYKQAERLNPEQRQVRLLTDVQKKLHLETLPRTIDCFDNSNISGSDAVAACVVFKMGKPSKNDYRKYIIKTVEGPDDYASMAEVVRRRYSRFIDESTALPDLILTDGGKGQMEVVRKVVEDELHLKIPIAGMAKNEHHRTNEILIGNPPIVVGMGVKDEVFQFFTRIQDEVHRFAISFHRDKRSKSQTQSELDTIPGIGKMTKQALLQHFKSLKRIKEADIQELMQVVGKSKANIIKDYYKKV